MKINVFKEIVKSQPKLFILIAALILVNIMMYAFSAGYQAPRVENLKTSWFDKRKSASAGHALGTAGIYRQGEQDLKVWEERIVRKKEFARVVGSLFEYADGHSLTLKGVTYKVDHVKDENLVAYVMSFNVSGKYGSIKKFLYDLARMREILTVDAITLNNTKVSEDSVDLKVQFTVYLKVEEQ